MLSTDGIGLQKQIYHCGPNVLYDATCDALSVREAHWPLPFPNVHEGCPRIQLREIVHRTIDARTQIALCISLSLMADHTGREYWESSLEGGDTHTSCIDPDPAEALRLLYEEAAAGHL